MKPPQQVSKGKKKVEAQSQELGEIQGVFRKYRQSVGVQMAVSKTVYSALLDKETKSSGQLKLSRGKLRLELKVPDETLLILNGSAVWMVQFLEGKPQISRTTLAGGTQRNPFAALLRQSEHGWKGFKLLKSERKEQSLEVDLKPPKAAEWKKIEKMNITVDTGKKEILRFKYWDDLENETTFTFAQVVFDVNLPSQEFKYVPPRGADVTEF